MKPNAPYNHSVAFTVPLQDMRHFLDTLETVDEDDADMAEFPNLRALRNLFTNVLRGAPQHPEDDDEGYLPPLLQRLRNGDTPEPVDDETGEKDGVTLIMPLEKVSTVRNAVGEYNLLFPNQTSPILQGMLFVTTAVLH